MTEEKKYSVQITNNRTDQKDIVVWTAYSPEHTLSNNESVLVQVTQSENTVNIKALDIDLARQINFKTTPLDTGTGPIGLHYDFTINVPLLAGGITPPVEEPVENVVVGDNPPDEEK